MVVKVSKIQVTGSGITAATRNPIWALSTGTLGGEGSLGICFSFDLKLYILV